MDTLLVSEIFGPTIQGEGPSAGRRAAFIRLGLCNLNCSWCDTPYTWDWHGQNGEPQDRSALNRVTDAEILQKVSEMNVSRIVITGGEPLVQRIKLGELVEALKGYVVEVETNGTLMPNEELLRSVDQWNVSPKLPHSGVAQAKAWKPEVLKALSDTERAAFKFVCQSPKDVRLVVKRCEGLIQPSQIWIMPLGIGASELVSTMTEIADVVVEHGFNLTSRLHVLAWGNRRGV